ncbi:RidA family protein [Stella sp.]|uniref:RidA family protein n=1 Tax=Stella sp. TaxID=2912054 RepID=UPI0035AFCFEE
MPHPDIVRLGGRFPNRSRTVVHGGLVWTLATSGTKVEDFAAQMRDALGQLDAELARAGTDRTRVLTVDVYLTDMARKAEMDAIWTEWVAPGDPPRRMTIETALDGPDLVELVCLAALPR